MKLVKQLSLFAIFTLVVGCATTHKAKVNFDKNEQVNTSSYKTFAWLKESKILAAPADLNPVMKVRVDKAIENAFAAKGYKLVNSPVEADFAISYTVGSRDKIKVDSFPATYRAGFGWGRSYYGGLAVGNETHVRSYSEGKLAIDVFDVKTKQPTWHGWGVKRITSADKNDPATTIKTIVDQVVAQFN
ncbi:DUF4136 domain-containing protein [Thalassotalea sp. M1531]|uniref:DUF4136 domain-containing protein n=1 Tax=Thalassotalea algicola TaxID=2716224 RepID=A0A7Y0Q8W2_9GAMM|nr:DUF4136 domain-containing protein [Thalassotalea algicola]NMP32570.1 DUF4136 domain-containing protein [Thalassotalea algicola]